MESQEYYIGNVKSFVNEYFPGSTGILITGSFNTPFFNESSDLDIILLSDWHRNTFVESYQYNGLKMQVIVLPFYDLDGVIYRDIAKGRGAIVSMLSKGLIIRDQNHIFERLKKQSLVLYERGPMPTQKELLDRACAKITSSIEDLEGSTDFDEQVFTVLEAYCGMLQLYISKKQIWNYVGKSASRELKYRDEAFHNRFVSSLEEFFGDRDKSKAILFLRKSVNDCGGELHFHSTRNFSEKCEGNVLTIYIQPASKDLECIFVNTLRNELCSFLYKHVDNVQLMSFVHHINGLYPAGAYIIVKSEQRNLEEYIMPKIRLFHLKSPHSIGSGILDNWQYPFKINPIESFGTKEIQEKICNYLSFIHNMCINEKFDKSLDDNVKKAIYVLQHYRCLNYMQEEEAWANYWNMIFEIYFKTHLNKMLPTSNLEYLANVKRAAIVSEYESCKDKMVSVALQTEQIAILCEIEQYYWAHEDCLDVVSHAAFYATKSEKLFYGFFKLTDIILDMFFIREKGLITYVLLHNEK